MMKKLVMLLMVAAMVTAAAQADVYILRKDGTKGADAGTAMESFLTANFPAGDLGTIYKGEYRGNPPALTANDLVIVLRETGSGFYDDSAAMVTAWNELATPILNMLPHVTRTDDWGWTNGADTTPTDGNMIETDVLVPADPLFAGVTLTGGFADLIQDDEDPSGQLAAGLLPAGCTMLAEGVEDGGTNPTAMLARIPKGVSWASNVGSSSGTQGAARIIYFAGTNDGIADPDAGIDDALTADGKVVLANCIEELLYAPRVDAGDDQAIIGSLSTSLSGSATTPDSNDLPLTYAWTAVPAAGVSFGDDTDPNTTVTVPAYGTYALTLAVTNDSGLTGSDRLTFTATAPGEATNPSPADGAVDVPVDQDLSWTAGGGAVSHDVWLGTDPEALVLVSDDQAGTSYDPGTLIKGRTYYWSVDEYDGTDTYPGPVWSFTVVANPAGTTWWIGGLGDPNILDPSANLWTDELNWTDGVPGVGDGAFIKVGEVDPIVEPKGPAYISTGDVAVATGMARWGYLDPNYPDTSLLEMTGGSLELGQWKLGVGAVNISGGTVEAGAMELNYTIGSVGSLNISGGTVTGGNLTMEGEGDYTVNLTGGTLDLASIVLRNSITAADPNIANIMDIAGGTLILDEDVRDVVGGYVDSGRIIAHGGTGTVVSSYDSGNDETTVIGCTVADLPDLTGDCAVTIDDLQLQVQDWLYATPASQVWSFNMDADPVGTGEFDLVVRNDNPNNANYTMTADSGRTVLKTEDTGTTMLDQQYEGITGRFDTHVDYVIKSTNEYAVDLWIPMGTSAAEGRQSTLGISTMGVLDTVDPNVLGSQKVELWGGTARQQDGYTPAVTETGFDKDAYLTISVDYDYDTDTFDWSMSDGAGDDRSGTGVAYADTGDGDGGYFTLRSAKYLNGAGNDDQGTAFIDQLDITIDGSLPIIKPGDIDLDGDVDLADFAKIAEKWLVSG